MLKAEGDIQATSAVIEEFFSNTMSPQFLLENSTLGTIDVKFKFKLSIDEMKQH